MGSTSSIAKVDQAQEAPAASPGDDDSDSNMRRSTAGKKTRGKGEGIPPPAPPPPPPPQPSASEKSSPAVADDQDEVDAPLYDQKMKEKVLGKDDGVTETKSEPDRKKTVIPLNESDRKAAENMKKQHSEFAAAFDGLLMFVSALREDLGLKTDRNFLQNAMERDVNNKFMECDDNGRKLLGDFLGIIGGGQVVYDSYHTIMTHLKLTHLTDKVLMNIQDNHMMSFLVGLRGIMWNYCDASLLMCGKLGTTGVFDYLLQDLMHMKTGIDNPNESLGYTFESCVGIIHNNSKHPSNRPKLRAIETGLHLLPYLKCKDTKVKMITLLTLSYILDESQNHLLLADDSVFDFILLMIKRAMKSKDHRFDGFSAQELVEGLTGLAKNDDNKKLLVKKGAVPMLVTIMEGGKDDEEKHAAVRCMWELAFDKENRKAFHENADLMKLLRSLKNSENKKVSKAASGALWEIHLEDVDKAVEKPGVVGSHGSHIMISYQWAEQKKLMQVKESLRESGFQVWMDIDNMGGSTLQAMAEAVQNAEVVLVCMSERYKESQNCRSEAEYAFSLQKPIVPLLMERNYKPDGWLGMIKGTKLFFDFSGKYEYEHKINDLVKELGTRGKSSFGVPIDESKIPVIRAAPVDAGKGPGIASWSSKDVHNWLNKSKITLNSHLQKLSGEHLVFLRKLSHRAPEFYFSYIERKLHLDTIEDMMHFSTALDSL